MPLIPISPKRVKKSLSLSLLNDNKFINIRSHKKKRSRKRTTKRTRLSASLWALWRQKRFFFFSSAALDSLLLLCASIALSFSLFVVNVDSASASAFVVSTPRKLQTDELATVRLFQENTPSVVYITNLAVRQDAFTLDVLEVPQGSGSGFVWDKQGHIVINYHVIRGASDLR
ncbi:hypothetical protein CMV_018210 [Castanea mollissima]|uniref:Uncharacterized protein n=1 Tax=Castanea mollissima TaxID=60419 RepID=A0A8J4R2T4_9ROSI|nr:hypothetical protein CMV_018210 [Castanea mollissima]